MGDYIAEPLSRKDIREMALLIRKSLHWENILCFPVVEMLEIMPDIFWKDGFMYEIVQDHTLPISVQGDTDVANHYMRIKESVYDGACAGIGRDRFSIAHEMGHYFLMNLFQCKFQRNISRRSIKAYEDPEWQAECFAGELLMPYHLISEMSSADIINNCKVSSAAAETQLRIINK